MSKDLDGKVALVTGGSRGIGRAISKRLARDGALVAVHYGKNREAANEVVVAIKAEGGAAFAIGGDLKEAGAAAKLFTALDADLTRLTGSPRFDILVNNAGIAPFVGFADTTEAVMDEIYAVNVKAPFFLTQEAVKRLNDGGRVISTSSIVARLPFPAVAAYSALKAPLNNLTKCLAVELGPRAITVNAVAPGVIATDLAEFVQTPEGQEFTKSKQALKRIGMAEDVADVVGFLAGPGARWVTGEVIEVGGGSGLTF
ncbi:MAG: SDR family oxidoreductase [Hyphomicrobium sp.]|jgi:NAD(P)-dependent dehydrogenase (short-subunit alcohol dehydrogenase family)